MMFWLDVLDSIPRAWGEILLPSPSRALLRLTVVRRTGRDEADTKVFPCPQAYAPRFSGIGRSHPTILNGPV